MNEVNRNKIVSYTKMNKYPVVRSAIYRANLSNVVDGQFGLKFSIYNTDVINYTTIKVFSEHTLRDACVRLN